MTTMTNQEAIIMKGMSTFRRSPTEGLIETARYG
jgi:hypothetical protein